MNTARVTATTATRRSAQRDASQGAHKTRMSSETFAQLFESEQKALKEGDVVRGTIVGLDSETVQVDVGFKSEGLVPLWELMDDEGKVLVREGDSVDVLVEEVEDAEGRIVLSKEKADRLKVWDEISKAFEADQAVDGTFRVATARRDSQGSASAPRRRLPLPRAIPPVGHVPHP